MSRVPALAARLFGAAVLVATVVAPLGGLFLQSLRLRQVVLPSGAVMRVAGHVTRADGLVRFQAVASDDPDADLTPVAVADGPGVVEREVWSAVRYAEVWRSPRTLGLLRNSVVLAAGGAILACLVGIPVGWVVARTRLPLRGAFSALLAAPLLLPPFFAAMGIATSVGGVLERLGLSGGTLQLTNGAVCFAALLFPIPALLVGRALASVPAGLVEAAVLAAGRRAATRRVVWPAVRPALLAGATLVFVVALCDFAVPDLLGTFLTGGAVPVHVFATEVFLQWTKYGNVGRAVATGAPFVLVVLALLSLVAVLVRRCPEGFLGGASRPRPPVPLGPLATVGALLTVVSALGLGLALPVASVAAWGFSPARVPETFARTVGLWGDVGRWLALGAASAAVATLAAVPLARGALRGGGLARAVGAGAVALPLAVPGMVLMIGTLLLWVPVPTPPNTLWKGVLVLVGRSLPYAVLAVALALREADPRMEEAARLLGAGPATVARRVWLPLARRGIASAFLLVFVLSLRELDAIQLVEPGILPVRIYDKVHFGRTGEVADLSMAYLALLAVPGALALTLLRRRRPRQGA